MNALECLKEVMRYRRGEGEYNFSGISDPQVCNDAVYAAWLDLEQKINETIAASK